MNVILNKDAKLKVAVIKLFLDNLEILATHPSQYGETKVLEMKIDLVPEALPTNPDWDCWTQIKRRIYEIR